MRSEVEEAIALLKSEDPASVEKAIALLQQSVFAFSMRVCNQREDAEDTMQEVLVKSVPVLSRFQSAKALTVWLYKVAKTRCLMSRRKSKFAPKQELSLEALMPDGAELETLGKGGINPENSAIKSQEAQWLRDAVQKLPPEYRIVLVLRDMEGLSDDEVAEITGLRAGTVRVRLHRARLFVRKEVAKRTGLTPAAKPTSRPVHAQTARPANCRAMFAQLSEYLDEQLDDKLCSRLEKHMDGCEPCKAFLSTLKQTISGLRNSASQTADPALARRLREDVLASYEKLLAELRQ